MVNRAKKELEKKICHNDTIMAQECVCMAHNTIEFSSDSSSSFSSDELLEILSDDSSYSGARKIQIKPVTSFNKSSTFPAKHDSDNEETPLKQPHQDAFT